MTRSAAPVARTDWMRSALKWVTIPSWLGSVLFHVLVAACALYLSQLPSCRGDMAGDDGESFRKVGIRYKTSTPADQPSETETQSDQSTPAESNQQNAENEQTLADQPPVPLQLPQLPSMPPVIGAGASPAPSAVDIDQMVKPLPSAEGGPAGSGAPAGGTSFLGIQDVGRRFVYVIDRSFSMANDHALQAAKLELQASLERLDETQQFQVIFYNNNFNVLQTRGGRFDVFSGTDIHRLKVSEQLRAIEPSGGTHHFPAILEALKFNPDVIFLLTDGAAESALSLRELEDIHRHNRHGTRIHCIEFGRGATSSLGDAGNFLKALARQNDGKYTYRDVTQGR